MALVTGANSGIGYETVRALADHGAHVVMACRNKEKAREARDKLEGELDRSSLELLPLDLADLDSVRRAAETFLSAHARLDILINNAGVMGTPYRQTADGFEVQMATNHLGHFALTGLLLDRIVTTPAVAGGDGQLAPAPPGPPPGWTTWPAHGAAQPLGHLRHLETGQPALHAGAEPAARRRGAGHHRRGRAPRAGPGATWPATAPPWATAGSGASSAARSGPPWGRRPPPGRCPCSAPPRPRRPFRRLRRPVPALRSGRPTPSDPAVAPGPGRLRRRALERRKS